MNSRLLTVIVLVAVVSLVVFLTTRSKPVPASEPEDPGSSMVPEATPSPVSPQPPDRPSVSELSPISAAPPAAAPVMDPVSPVAVALPAPMPVAAVPPVPDGAAAPLAVPLPPGAEINPEEIAKDLDQISLSFRDYRTLMAQNPIGNNAEIT